MSRWLITLLQVQTQPRQPCSCMSTMQVHLDAAVELWRDGFLDACAAHRYVKECPTNSKHTCPLYRFSSDAALELLGDGFLDATQTLRQFYDLFTSQLSLPGTCGSLTNQAVCHCL